MSRFIALNAALLAVADHGGDHVATLDTEQNLIFALTTGAAETSYDFAYAQQLCSGFRLGDKDDWRLPSVPELQRIVDYTRHGPAIDAEAFPGTESDWYWTGTPHAKYASNAWCVVFDFGGVDGNGRDYECFVRAVRSASPAAGQ